MVVSTASESDNTESAAIVSTDTESTDVSDLEPPQDTTYNATIVARNKNANCFIIYSLFVFGL